MLGARIASLRRTAGLSQAELAKKLRISPSAVGMYEQGRRDPPLDVLVDISKILEVSTDYLLTGSPVSPGEEKKVGEAVLESLTTAQDKLHNRPRQPFSRQELAVLFAAMLMEP